MSKSFVDKLKHYANLTVVCIVSIILYIFAVIWIFQSFESLIDLFSPKEEVFKLDRDIFIGFGIFVLFTSLGCHIITKKIAPDKITEKHNNTISRMTLISLCLFTLPFVIEPLYDYKLNREGYYVCEEATHRWLYLKTSYYTNSEQACIDLISETN